MQKIMSSPLLKTGLLVIGVIVVLKLAAPFTAKIPVIGKYLVI